MNNQVRPVHSSPAVLLIQGTRGEVGGWGGYAKHPLQLLSLLRTIDLPVFLQQNPAVPEAGGRRASFGLGDGDDDCLDDAMDVDSPVPAAAVQRVAAQGETRSNASPSNSPLFLVVPRLPNDLCPPCADTHRPLFMFLFHPAETHRPATRSQSKLKGTARSVGLSLLSSPLTCYSQVSSRTHSAASLSSSCP